MTRQISFLIAICLASAITTSSVKSEKLDGSDDYSNQSAIGIAAVAVNVVKGTVNTKTKSVNVSDRVFKQEIIETNSVSSTQILFLDETVLSIGPDSRLVMDEMVYDPDANKGKVVVTAAQGLFSFVSGSLPSESYEIHTPTATIGVRGTKFDLFVSRKGASTVILRSGAVDLKNINTGKTRRIATVGMATSVVTKKSDPTPPAPPSPELEQILKPLSNPIVLQGKNPEQVNTLREGVEKESEDKIEKALKKEQKREKATAERNKNKEQKREKATAERNKNKEQKKERLADKREKRAEKKSFKQKKQLARKPVKGVKKVAKKASKGAKKAAKKASKGAKKAAKKASKAAKKASKAAMKAAKAAMKAAKVAKKRAKAAVKDGKPKQFVPQ